MDSEHDEADPGWLPLRLRVLETGILHKDLGLAVLDAYEETQIGRDATPVGSETPRIRLKEMAVSKLHATVFWDRARREWAVVDMGSKHGTFVQHGGAAPARLSPPRTASIPRPLHHLDRLVVGSTTFLCHIHEDGVPCAECTSSGQGVIPLFAVPRDSTAEKRPADATAAHTQDAKRALTSLKRTLLARLAHPAQPPAAYVDRSARRRAMHATSQLDSPGVRSSPPASQEPTPAPPAVLPEHNVGRQLLLKQGWQPGTTLGSATDGGRVEPLEVHAGAPRAGLGMHHVAPRRVLN